ncbi:MAG: response regulator transcription factor [Microgenomates group bacterium]
MQILIIEDEVKLAQSIKRGLEQSGYSVQMVHDGQEGLEEIEINHTEYDLVILDLNLPNLTGIEICQSVRSQDIKIPIIMLTARDTVEDKVAGLNSGADDYLVKPFSFIELLARVRSLLRRPAAILFTKLSAGQIILDPTNQRVWRTNDEIKLTSREFSLLEYLVRNKGRIVPREEILSHVWDQSFDPASNVIDVHITNLKKKISGNTDNDQIIKTIRGSGYRIDD